MTFSAKRISNTVTDTGIETKVITATAEATTGTLAAISDSIKFTTGIMFNDLCHIRSNIKAIHRQARSIFSPLKPLGSLTEEKANFEIPTLTLDEVKIIALAYNEGKKKILKSNPDPKSLSRITLDDALLPSTTDENRAKKIIAFVYNPEALGTDLSYICVDFLRKKLGLDFEYKKEAKVTHR